MPTKPADSIPITSPVQRTAGSRPARADAWAGIFCFPCAGLSRSLQQTFEHRKKLAFLESDMSRQAFAEAIQCPGIVLSQGIEQSAQLTMVCQGTLEQRLCFRAVQERQQRYLLDPEVRLQFIRECPDHALAG